MHLLLELLLATLGNLDSTGVLLVVVSEDSAQTDISRTDLRRLFGGQGATGPDGVKLIPINVPPGHPARTTFDRLVLGFDPERVGRYWVDRRIKGQTGPPSTLPSPALVVRFVRSVPHTVGYIPGPAPPGVRVLRVDGRSPEDPDYPLRLAP